MSFQVTSFAAQRLKNFHHKQRENEQVPAKKKRL